MTRLARLLLLCSLLLPLAMPATGQRYAASYQGAYSSGTTYQKNDIVTSGNVAYVSLSFGNVGNAVTNTSYWTALGSASATLGNSGIAAGTYGSATQVASCTFNAQGIATNCQNITISGTGGASSGYVSASTLAAAVTACGSTPSIIQVTTGISVPSSMTVPSNCALAFQTGGELLPASGAVVTINSSVTAPTNQQIFGGAGTISGLAQDVHVEWFGAVGNNSTDDTAQIQAAINSVGKGHAATIQYATYRTSSAISIPSQVGLVGPGFGFLNGTYAQILSTSSSADIIDLNGTTESYLENLAVGRTVLPNVGTRGIACYAAQVYLYKNLSVADSYTNLYYHGCPTGYQGTYSVTSIWGQNGVSGYGTTQKNGFELDSEDGTAMNSAVFNGLNIGTTQATDVLFYVHGKAINDINVTNINASSGIGLLINYDGPLTNGIGVQDSSFDLHFNQITFDACPGECIQINNVPANSSIEFTDLYAVGASNTFAVAISNSYGVRITGSQIGNSGSGGGLLISGGGQNMATNGQWTLFNGGNAITLSQTTANVIANHTIYGQQNSPMGTAVQVQASSTNNIVSGVTETGYGAIGINEQTSSSGNSYIGNSIASTITTPYGGTAVASGGSGSSGAPVVVGTKPSAIGFADAFFGGANNGDTVMYAPTAGTDAKAWDWFLNNFSSGSTTSTLNGRLINDAGTIGTPWISVSRNGNAITAIDFKFQPTVNGAALGGSAAAVYGTPTVTAVNGSAASFAAVPTSSTSGGWTLSDHLFALEFTPTSNIAAGTQVATVNFGKVWFNASNQWVVPVCIPAPVLQPGMLYQADIVNSQEIQLYTGMAMTSGTTYAFAVNCSADHEQ